jgi:uncharacterized radical SAM superfamily Fe-S cluster-containing enzyme
MYDFVDLSRDITATPFPPDILQVSLRSYDNNGEYARNILSCLQRFAHDKNLKVDVELGIVAVVGRDGMQMRMCFMEARCVNYVIASSLDFDVSRRVIVS